MKALEELLKRWDMDQVLVFRHTKRGVDKLLEILKRRGHKAEAIHGDLSQRERERTRFGVAAAEVTAVPQDGGLVGGIERRDNRHGTQFGGFFFIAAGRHAEAARCLQNIARLAAVTRDPAFQAQFLKAGKVTVIAENHRQRRCAAFGRFHLQNGRCLADRRSA